MAGGKSKTPAILKAAVDHFSELGRKVIEVPEWDEAVIYSTPLTLKERDRLLLGGGEIKMSVMADVLIMKAEDKDGEKLFTLEHKMHLLTKVDAAVVSRVAMKILSGPSVEDAEKNS